VKLSVALQAAHRSLLLVKFSTERDF